MDRLEGLVVRRWFAKFQSVTPPKSCQIPQDKSEGKGRVGFDKEREAGTYQEIQASRRQVDVEDGQRRPGAGSLDLATVMPQREGRLTNITADILLRLGADIFPIKTFCSLFPPTDVSTTLTAKRPGFNWGSMTVRKFGGRQPTGTPSVGWSAVVVIASLLAGASVVHNIFKPNLTLPPVDQAGEENNAPKNVKG